MKYLFTLLYLCSFSIFAQELDKDTIFLNEKSEVISKSLFKQKCNSAIFHCKTFSNGDSIENILYYRFYFGKLSNDDVNTIYTHFDQLSSKNITLNKRLLIHYTKTLLGYKEMLKIRSDAFKKALDDPERRHKFSNNTTRKFNVEEYSNKIYRSRLDNQRKYHSKHIKKVERNYNTNVINIFNKNKGQNIENKHFKWVQDSTKTFLNKNFSSVMILKPNGEYFIKYNSHFDRRNIYKLLSVENWSAFFNDWNKSLKNNSIKGIGIINVLTN